MAPDPRELLEHFGDCAKTPTLIARVCAGPDGERHARTFIGALLTTDLLMRNPAVAHDDEDSANACRSDLVALYRALAEAHNSNQRFDA